MIPLDPTGKSAHIVAIRLLEAALSAHRRDAWKPSELIVYFSLVTHAIGRGWGKIPNAGKVADRCGCTPATARRAVGGIKARGFLPYGHLIANQETIEKHAAERFERLTPTAAKAAGYKPITYAYQEEERHLLNSLLVGNFDQPVVIVEFERGGKPLLELWRHQDAIAKWTQAERAFDMRIRMGEAAKL